MSALMNLEFQIPVTGSTTPKRGLEVRSDWLWPQLGQYWAPSGSSELQYQQELTAGILQTGSRISVMSDQGDFFEPAAAPEPSAPLATRLRPRSFDQLIGQKRVVEVLRGLTASGHLPSIVLWGPPGSGKTTLAGLLAAETKARMVAMSAVTAGPPHCALHRRDPPLQQGPAGRHPAARRRRHRDADRRHHGEPVVRGDRAAALAQPRVQAGGART